ncbi:MAG: hypothetical protein [Bacteriophage sp.]|nr:MAG: hypothetical protein [Bacteriophage sp.]
MKQLLLVGVTLLLSSACIGVQLSKIEDLENNNKELDQQVSLYRGLNDQQQDIILKYKQVSGIEVSSITQSLSNEQLIIELEKRINDMEEKGNE